MFAEQAGQLNRFVNIPASLGPVGRRYADEERQMRGPIVANRIDDLQHQARAVLEAAAVCICALVGERREKLVQQIAVCGMDLDELEARLVARRAA